MRSKTPKWTEYFYRIALDVAEKSKDTPPVGAVVVREEHKDNAIVSTGFNGPAREVLDRPERFEDQKAEDVCDKCGRAPMKEKLKWSCHAEANAIYNAARIGVSIRGCTIYVTKHPCVPCANAIVQAGITKVYTEDPGAWKSDPYDDGDGTVSRRILQEGGVTLHRNTPAKAEG